MVYRGNGGLDERGVQTDPKEAVNRDARVKELVGLGVTPKFLARDQVVVECTLLLTWKLKILALDGSKQADFYFLMFGVSEKGTGWTSRSELSGGWIMLSFPGTEARKGYHRPGDSLLQTPCPHKAHPWGPCLPAPVRDVTPHAQRTSRPRWYTQQA